MSSTSRRAAGLGLAAAMLASPALLTVPGASAASAVPCRAHMSDSTPKQYSNVYVVVRTSSKAYVHAVAHYKTSTTSKNGRANSTGHASIKFYISGATPGRRVPVTVTVTKNGHHGYCSTSFTPHR